jgi:hypothetical protein
VTFASGSKSTGATAYGRRWRAMRGSNSSSLSSSSSSPSSASSASASCASTAAEAIALLTASSSVAAAESGGAPSPGAVPLVRDCGGANGSGVKMCIGEPTSSSSSTGVGRRGVSDTTITFSFCFGAKIDARSGEPASAGSGASSADGVATRSELADTTSGTSAEEPLGDGALPRRARVCMPSLASSASSSSNGSAWMDSISGALLSPSCSSNIPVCSPSSSSSSSSSSSLIIDASVDLLLDRAALDRSKCCDCKIWPD